MRLLLLVVCVLLATPDRASAACSAGCLNNECYGSTAAGYGDCTHGCNAYYYGNKCDMKCSNCVNGNCERFPLSCNSEGRCAKNAGSCNEGCKPGFCGYNCNTHCPAKCISCYIDYYNLKCTDCKNGYHGVVCDLSCPVNCLSDRCYKNSGDCSDGCDDWYTGDKCDVIHCDKGLYLDGSQCIACPENCASCSSATNCDACRQGYYGVSCENSCSLGCQNTLCYKLTGTCFGSCNDGYTGNKCDQCDNHWYNDQHMCEQCPDTCLSCASNSDCSSCKQGYYGDNCGHECPQSCVSCSSSTSCGECITGYYGTDCGSTCSPGCLNNDCDKSDGRCTSTSCTEGYAGDTCEQCLDGWYNYQTRCEKCPTNCLSCTSGDLCSLCEQGYFGVKCESECSPGCSNNECDKTDGKCNISCHNGYQGHKCDQCLPGWYKTTSQCKQCQQNCLSCKFEYGCTSCKVGYYGANCRNPCVSGCLSCTSQYDCESCKVGHYGQYCQNLCSSGCINGQCAKADGQCKCKANFTGFNCSQCANGKFGTYCDQDCPQTCVMCLNATNCGVCKTGYYGSACELPCSVGCAGDCMNKSGTCDPCKVGFSGNKCCVKSNNCKLCSSSTSCSECKSGYQGIKCEETCPKNCNVSCDKHTGNCVTCKTGYVGPDCEDTCSKNCIDCREDGICNLCKTGFYGSHCDNACPGNCYACSDNKTCFPCKSGYFGQVCDVKCPQNCVSCSSRHDATRCNQCYEGYTGPTCSSECNPECKDCLIYFGSYCTSCALGKHTNNYFNEHKGQKYLNCKNKCSAFCLHGICDYITGICPHGCVNGYVGEQCLCPEKCTKCSESSQTCYSGFCEKDYTGDTCSCSTEACTDSSCSSCSNNTWYTWSGWAQEFNLDGSFCCKCSATCKDNKCSDSLDCTNGCIDGFYGNGCNRRCSERHLRCLTCTDIACTHCQSGYFPSDTGICIKCSQNCVNRYCSSLNGTCFEGCKGGFWDKDCIKTCVFDCNECDQDSGTCTVCKNGKYLRDCSENCSGRCLNTGASAMCDIKDGSCKLGCTSKLFHGKTCEFNCNTTCSGNECDWVTGKCSNGCISNYFGEWCENKCSDNCIAGSDSTRCQSSNGTCNFDCLEGYFGHDCETRCGANCVNATCSRGTGHCTHGCIGGFEGSDCAQVLKQPGSVDTGVIVAVAALILLIAAVFVICFVLHRRYMRRTASTKVESTPARPDHSSIAMDDVGAVASNASVAVSLLEENAVDLPRCDVHADVSGTYYNASAITRMAIDRLEEYVTRKPKESLKQEFLMFPKTLVKPYTDSQRPDNISRNRYKDVYPYDFNRVKLQTGSTDYINASYIDGFKKKNAYIAALGPTDKTTDAFVTVWCMIWQQQIEKIVMLTNLVEGGKMKCDQYWPDPDTSQQYGDVTVTCLAEDTTSQFTVRALSVTMNDEKRVLHHFHYTAWPDRGVPDDVTGLIEFRDNVLAVNSTLDGPIMVHCSAGVGRTGTYIALDYLTNEGEETGSVDVFECVSNLRQQRIWMVQTEEQYVYLHDAVVHSLTFDSKPIPSERFKDYLQSLTPANLQKSYEHLNFGYDRREPEDKESVQKNSSYKNKNNPTADIPGDRYRARLYLVRVDDSCDYINAVYLDSFRSRNQFIVAQTPMKSTVDDFLTLLFQDNVPCIVDIQPRPRNKKYVGEYLPVDNSKQVNHGIFTVKSTKVKSSPQFILRRLTITRNSQDGPEERVFYHYQLVDWNDKSTTPQSPQDFITFIREVAVKAKEDSEDGKILVHCVSGAERSGLFCSVSVMLQKMESEHEISVVNTVRQIKSRRPRAIPNKEQYLFCHQCINAYLDTFDTYSNFTLRQ